MSKTIRIGMWSGPRNISTAMMRAWENRPDCFVSDEPLYAHYLAHTQLDHPARDEVIANGQTNWQKVIDDLLGSVPQQRTIWYQKHMTHHMLPHISRDWIRKLRNVLLIRDPRQVVASYVKSRATVTAEDIGLPQQVLLYEQLSALGEPPPVIDSTDFLTSPAQYLQTLCQWLEIPFTDRMLHWPKGPRDTDGIWAPHWYAKVWESTGFDAPPQSKTMALEGAAAEVANVCMPHYQWLYEKAIKLG